ncbi:hypothetical protein Agabi119p4_11246 [Agaricus bisporus var. burnettii]|uniref:Uncharacterized protein n=1 Tax=Agaricus bisporus var. burnettii TaxID=192524 RepID=A0A8H7EWI1_AGABI|nr:hypothetical protein Agabi119p4_11246 [Agaricus bisporus var. burnettii]
MPSVLTYSIRLKYTLLKCVEYLNGEETVQHGSQSARTLYADLSASLILHILSSPFLQSHSELSEVRSSLLDVRRKAGFRRGLLHLQETSKDAKCERFNKVLNNLGTVILLRSRLLRTQNTLVEARPPGGKQLVFIPQLPPHTAGVLSPKFRSTRTPL